MEQGQRAYGQEMYQAIITNKNERLSRILEGGCQDRPLDCLVPAIFLSLGGPFRQGANLSRHLP